MSIWAEAATVPKISQPPTAAPKSNERTKMSNYNFDAIQSVPFDASSNDMEQILSSISISTSSKSDDDFPGIGGSESTRMSSLLQKLGSYFSHPNNKMIMNSPLSVGGANKRNDTDVNGLIDKNSMVKLSPTNTIVTPTTMGTTIKRHGSQISSNSNRSDNSSISANSSHSTKSTGQLCSETSSANDKRNIDKCDEILRSTATTKPTTVPAPATATTATTDALCNDAGESFTLPRVNLKQR